MDQVASEPGWEAQEEALAERGGYDPIRADGPLRQAIRLLRQPRRGPLSDESTRRNRNDRQ